MDKKKALKLVKKDWNNLSLVGEFNNDPEIVMEAIRQSYRALGLASDELRNDKEFVLEVIKIVDRADVFECFGDNLKKDKAMVKEMLNRYPDRVVPILDYVDPSITNDNEFMSDLINNDNRYDGVVYSWYSGPNVKAAKDKLIKLIKEDVKNNNFQGETIGKIDSRMFSDEDFMTQVLKIEGIDHWYVYNFMKKNDSELLKNKDFLYKMIKEYPHEDSRMKIHISSEVYDELVHDAELLTIIKERIIQSTIRERETNYDYNNMGYGAIGNAPSNVFEDKEFLMNVLKERKAWRSMVYGLIARNNRDLFNDKEFIFDILKINPKDYSALNRYNLLDDEMKKEIAKDKELFNSVFNSDIYDPEIVKHLSEEEKNDINVVGPLIASNYRAMGYVGNVIRGDEKLLSVFMSLNGNDSIADFYIYASDDLKRKICSDEEQVLKILVSGKTSCLEYVGDDFKNREFYLKAIEANSHVWNATVDGFWFIPEEYKTDKKFIKEAVVRNPRILEYKEDDYLQKYGFKNKDVLLQAIVAHPTSSIYKVLRESSWFEDRSFLEKAIKLNPKVWEIDELRWAIRNSSPKVHAKLTNAYEASKAKHPELYEVDENAQEVVSIDPSLDIEERMKLKYGFNKEYIELGLKIAKVDKVLEKITPIYESLTEEEKQHIAGTYKTHDGTLSLSKGPGGNLLAIDNRTKKEVKLEKEEIKEQVTDEQVVDLEVEVNEEPIKEEKQETVIAPQPERATPVVEKPTKAPTKKAKVSKEKKIALEVVNRYGRGLQSLSNEMKDDKDVVLAAVKKDPTSFEFASERLQKDNEVRKTAGLAEFKQETPVETKQKEKVTAEVVKEPAKGKSRKMQGHYDGASEEVKKAYDEMMKKSFTNELNKLSNEEIAYLNALFKDWCKGIDTNNMTPDDGKIFAIYTKINNRYKKIVKASADVIEEAKDKKSIDKADDAVVKKM